MTGVFTTQVDDEDVEFSKASYMGFLGAIFYGQ
jgi:hypothetical protein